MRNFGTTLEINFEKHRYQKYNSFKCMYTVQNVYYRVSEHDGGPIFDPIPF